MPTPTRLLIETRLGRPLGEFVDEFLANGKGWRSIAAEIEHRTNVSVSHESLRQWIKAEREAAA